MADIPTVPLVPNEAVATAAGYTEQADIDQYDWFIMQLGLAGWGVISGCQVTAQTSPDMTVVVAPGIIQAGGQQIHVSGGTSPAFSASATNPKYSFVEIRAQGGNLDGSIVRNQGTAATAPTFPQPNPGNIVLAALTIPANATQITTSQIRDKRALIDNAFSPAAKVFFSGIDTTRMRP